jgi:hypothetical protein
MYCHTFCQSAGDIFTAIRSVILQATLWAVLCQATYLLPYVLSFCRLLCGQCSVRRHIYCHTFCQSAGDIFTAICSVNLQATLRAVLCQATYLLPYVLSFCRLLCGQCSVRRHIYCHMFCQSAGYFVGSALSGDIFTAICSVNLQATLWAVLCQATYSLPNVLSFCRLL